VEKIIMAVKKKIKDLKVKATEVIEDVVAETELEMDSVVSDNKEFSVYDTYGHFIRTYSTENHGEDAESFAKGFALKINGSIK
jgi:hypothetical protein